MIIRAILPSWAAEEFPTQRRVREGQYSPERIEQLNALYYNIYYLPNYPSIYNPKKTVDGADIDTFDYVFVDMDLKDKTYESKEHFLETVADFPLTPTRMVDSGGGVHCYWRVMDLDAMSYLRLQRRLMRQFKTDEAVGQIYQLMRLPGTVNTKQADNLRICAELISADHSYTSEQLDAALPPITAADEEYCKQHFDKTYGLTDDSESIDDKLPVKFGALLKSNNEVNDIWAGKCEDRSAGDFRIGHIMYASGFSRAEALSVLVNSAKALGRSPKHRVSYATNIVDKIWTFEETAETDQLSYTVKDILQKSGDAIKGTRFPCYSYLDNTINGFRLGQVIGLVAGSGVGKTAIALNMFKGFVESNPDYDHFFIPLEQPAREIADRWKTMCGENTDLYEKVHIISNYDNDGNFRDLSLETIKNHILDFQKSSGKKAGCVVIDHIGVLSNEDRMGQDEGVKKLAKAMKSFAVQTNTLLVMQSQTSREKAGIGDLELNKDAAFGTSVFENFCDYLITVWQPLKRCYNKSGCPTVTAFKFCKIRHKKRGEDKIQEDVPYTMIFDPKTEILKEMTQDEEKSFDFFNKMATNLRKLDRKTDLVIYTTIKPEKQEADEINGKASNNQDTTTTDGTPGLH